MTRRILSTTVLALLLIALVAITTYENLQYGQVASHNAIASKTGDLHFLTYPKGPDFRSIDKNGDGLISEEEFHVFQDSWIKVERRKLKRT